MSRAPNSTDPTSACDPQAGRQFPWGKLVRMDNNQMPCMHGNPVTMIGDMDVNCLLQPAKYEHEPLHIT